MKVNSEGCNECCDECDDEGNDDGWTDEHTNGWTKTNIGDCRLQSHFQH